MRRMFGPEHPVLSPAGQSPRLKRPSSLPQNQGRDAPDQSLFAFLSTTALEVRTAMQEEERWDAYMREKVKKKKSKALPKREAQATTKSKIRIDDQASNESPIKKHVHQSRNAKWRKIFPVLCATFSNPLHHHTVLEAALRLVNALIQSRTSTGLSFCTELAKQVNLLVALLNRTESHKTTMEAIRALVRLVSLPRHCPAVIEARGVEELIDLCFRHSSPKIVETAAECLWRILRSSSLSHKRFFEGKGSEVFSSILRKYTSTKAEAQIEAGLPTSKTITVILHCLATVTSSSYVFHRSLLDDLWPYIVKILAKLKPPATVPLHVCTACAKVLLELTRRRGLSIYSLKMQPLQ